MNIQAVEQRPNDPEGNRVFLGHPGISMTSKYAYLVVQKKQSFASI